MGENEKPTPIESVDPTFGMSEEDAEAAKQAARMRHPAFNPKVYKELVSKALDSDETPAEPSDDTGIIPTSGHQVKNFSSHITQIGKKRIAVAKIDEQDGEKPL